MNIRYFPHKRGEKFGITGVLLYLALNTQTSMISITWEQPHPFRAQQFVVYLDPQQLQRDIIIKNLSHLFLDTCTYITHTHTHTHTHTRTHARTHARTHTLDSMLFNTRILANISYQELNTQTSMISITWEQPHPFRAQL